jgi:excisionase family DNA binding protein
MTAVDVRNLPTSPPGRPADVAFLTVEEAARFLRVSPPTIYRRVAEGRLPAVRLGAGSGPLRIPVAELDRFLEGELLAAARRD